MVRSAGQQANHRILAGSIERMAYVLAHPDDDDAHAAAISAMNTARASRAAESSPQLAGFFRSYDDAVYDQ